MIVFHTSVRYMIVRHQSYSNETANQDASASGIGLQPLRQDTVSLLCVVVNDRPLPACYTFHNSSPLAVSDIMI